jgi:hypothetical protein
MKRTVIMSILFGAVGLVAWGQAWPPAAQGQTPPVGFGQPQNPGPSNAGQNGGALNGSSQPGIDADAAAHGVARLSLMNGTVSVAHGNLGEMAGAVVNAPLLTEDRVLTAGDGRAEVQFDGANQVRLAGSTEVRMGDLQFKRYQVQIAQGLVIFRVLRDNDALVEISTPTLSVHPLRQGTYRVSVNAEGLTEVTVRAGDAEVSSPTGTEPLRAGQTLLSRGNPADPEFRTAVMGALDEWDRWNADRDRVFENAQVSVAPNVSPDIYGTEDLNAYGRWTPDPNYGNVWVPNQTPDWAPYQDGRWTYEDYYGWTWIPYEPWGWAPYHYGRWFRGGYGWAWYPGPIGARYAWSPALVGFFGWGAPGFGVGIGFGFGFGNVGWVPLAPFEVYRPWYGRGFAGGFGGVRSTAIVGNTNIAGVYANARYSNAVTSMRTGDFGRGAVNASSSVRASAADLSHASAFNGGLPMTASRESRSFTANGGTALGGARGMPTTNSNTSFYSSPSMTAARATTGNRGAGGFNNASNNGANNGAANRGFSSAGTAPAGNAAANAGGWRRFDPATSAIPRTNGGATGTQNYAPRSQGFQGASGSLAVRIAPPMVNSRPQYSAAPNTGAPGGAPRSYAPSGGFGAPRPSAPAASGARAGGGGRSGHR